MRIVLILLMLLLPLSLAADTPQELDYSNFASLPMLHAGRIKPLDSFARIALKRIHGAPYLENQSAIAWLAQLLFSPDRAAQQAIFLLPSDDLARMLSLPSRSDRLYSFAELAPAIADHESAIKPLLGKASKELSKEQQQLVRVYVGVNDFAELMDTFSLFAPLPVICDGKIASYLDLIAQRQAINTRLAAIVKRKQSHIEQYTPPEQCIAMLSYRLSVMEGMDSNNTLLRIIPPLWEGSQEWLAPWAVIEKGAGSPQGVKLFTLWQQAGDAYRKGDTVAWKTAIGSLHEMSLHSDAVREPDLTLEVQYNALNPLSKALILYAMALIFAVAGLLRHSPRIARLAYYAMGAGAFCQGCALLSRMIILMRPPVSTLYESMLFVSFVAVAIGLWLERRRKSGEGLIISAAIALLLLLAANVFAGDSDTLEVLVAVLNTNFWLATHVVCITAGYGSSLVAGMMAHLLLFKKAMGQEEVTLRKRLYHVALVALFFTATGTMLGGIWADQSWGRFWGWDPKENGALWIVLWLIWLLHGRIAGQMGELTFTVLMALINIVVALAWVGVNLLSVGLHSYGFTDEAAQGLMAFCIFELGIVTLLTILCLLKKRSYAS